MTDYQITVFRVDGTEETHTLVGASQEPDSQQAIEDGSDWQLEDGHVFVASPTIEATTVEEL